MNGDADALRGTDAERVEAARPTLDGGCGCRIVGPLGVGSLLADPPLVHKIIGGQVYAVAYCAGHRAAPDLLAALHESQAVLNTILAERHMLTTTRWDNLMGECFTNNAAAIAKATGG